MRALLAALLLLVAPTVAAGKPLDDDRSFARDGLFMVDGPARATGVVAHPDGGTLYAGGGDLLRLSPTGRRREAPPLVPAGNVHELIPGLAVGFETPFPEFGTPLPLTVWRLAPDGTTRAHHRIAVPARTVSVRQAVRRGDGFALLLGVSRPKAYTHTLRIAALTADGALDTTWGDGGYREVGEKSVSIGGTKDGSVLIATNRTKRCISREVRPALRVQRLAPDGRAARARTHLIGGRQHCTTVSPGEIHSDRRGRITVAAGLSKGGKLVRLRKDLRRDRRFGRGGTVRLTKGETWYLPMALAPRPGGGGVAVGFTTINLDGEPRAHVALVGGRGRLIRSRRLRVRRRYPTSELDDLAFDRAGRLVAAGALNDENAYIREDFGQPHLAVWRLRSR